MDKTNYFFEVSLETNLTRRFNLKMPVIQAPMAGGIATPQLVAAVSNMGGLGFLPLGYLNPQQVRQNIQETKKLTAKPFGVNIFVSQIKDPIITDYPAMKTKLNEYRKQLKIKEPSSLTIDEPSIEEIIEIVLSESIPIVSFTFGIPSSSVIEKLKCNQVFIIGAATTVNEGLAWKKAGCDALVAQGFEAGGHRGTFLGPTSSSQVGLIALLSQLVRFVELPIIAAGGIMDGRSIAAALTLGASAVQMGTAFITCKESGASELYKREILNSTEESTLTTNAFTGKYARAIKNSFVREIEKDFTAEQIPPYPTQHFLTQDIRREGAKQGSNQYSSFWAGQGTRLNEQTEVSLLMLRLEQECKEALGAYIKSKL